MTQSVYESGNTVASEVQTATKDSGSLASIFSTTQFWFWFSVFTVSAISFYDAYLVYEYRDAVVEQNPICKWLIDLEPDSVIMFLLGKGMGTLCVVTALVGLRKFWRPISFPVALSLVVFQCGLMVHIHTSDDLPEARSRVAFSEAQQRLADQRWADELFEREYRRSVKARNRSRRVASRRRANANNQRTVGSAGRSSNRSFNSGGRNNVGNVSQKPVPSRTESTSDRRR